MRSELTRFLTKELLTDRSPEALAPEEDLLGSGLLDSLGVMQLVWFIETEFGVQVPPEDVTIDNFQSVDRIATYVEGRRGGD